MAIVKEFPSFKSSNVHNKEKQLKQLREENSVFYLTLAECEENNCL